MGYIVYLIVNLLSGDLFDSTEDLVLFYFPSLKPYFDKVGKAVSFISRKHKENKKIDDLNKKLLESGNSPVPEGYHFYYYYYYYYCYCYKLI